MRARQSHSTTSLKARFPRGAYGLQKNKFCLFPPDLFLWGQESIAFYWLYSVKPWISHYAAKQNVAGSRPDKENEFFF
jgi:hypothetical protein